METPTQKLTQELLQIQKKTELQEAHNQRAKELLRAMQFSLQYNTVVKVEKS